jgi:CDP-diacylglycerol---glycerol-3-phosphate 3-phosphatidyltransferase
MPPSRLNLANGITLARIAACPAIFVLALSPHPGHLLAAFLLFLAAALSDLWDGYLARKHGWVTNMGMLLDPLADKLLLVSTFVPFYLVSQRPDPLTDIPWWGPLPLWVVLVIFGREALVTVLRSWAARRGSVIGAGRSGKVKAFVQNIFSGSLLLWYALARTAAERGWAGTAPWEAWGVFHGAVTGSTLLGALVLTVYSMVVYLWQNRALMTGAPS